MDMDIKQNATAAGSHRIVELQEFMIKSNFYVNTSRSVQSNQWKKCLEKRLVCLVWMQICLLNMSAIKVICVTFLSKPYHGVVFAFKIRGTSSLPLIINKYFQPLFPRLC